LSFGFCFCPKIDTRIILIIPTKQKQIIHINSFNFNEKSLEFIVKNQIAYVLKK